MIQMKILDKIKKRILDWLDGTGDELDFILQEEYLEIT
jgi:hypothetical protein